MIDLDDPEVLEAELIERELARRNYLDFVQYVTPEYDAQRFHVVMANHLQRFEEGLIKRLMITVPPQHGKSELSTRHFPPYLYGRNPKRKIALGSFSASKASKFSREIQQKIDSDRYAALFPEVRLASHKDINAKRTEQEFDIVGKGGSLKAVGRSGPLTGDPVDIMILDDLFKDGTEAKSPTIREKTWADWIVPVVETRLHNNSQVLYVTTRWDEDDPAGRFIARDGLYSPTNPTGWVLLNFPALKTKDITLYDDRREGEALWPARHSRQRMEAIRASEGMTFDALYQGDPKPSQEAVIFNDWITIDAYPDHVDHEFNVLDFGYSNDPTAGVKVGKTGQNLYLDELFYETHMTNQDIIKRAHLTDIMNVQLELICDKAEPKSIEELKRGYYDETDQRRYIGLNASACDKGPGSILAGISKLKQYTVHVTRRSTNIIREKNAYQWVMAGGKATNVPVDRDNHTLDAIRSGVFTKYSKPQGGTGRAYKIPPKRGKFDN